MSTCVYACARVCVCTRMHVCVCVTQYSVSLSKGKVTHSPQQIQNFFDFSSKSYISWGKKETWLVPYPRNTLFYKPQVEICKPGPLATTLLLLLLTVTGF